ncbi:MAG: AMP-binding protein [Actinomycetota bacterium]|nr:AMP-binding protein [Actinomycetota bacterium]
MTGESVLDLFEASARAEPDAVALAYFGAVMGRAELDGLSERVARVFAEARVGEGDRAIICLQNTPLMCAALLACWKLGAIAIPVNPMVRTIELGHMARDSGARLLVAEPTLADVVHEVMSSLPSPLEVLWSSPHDLAGRDPIPFTTDDEVVPPFGSRLLDALAALDSLPPDQRRVSPGLRRRHDLALICYTSGTTGPPKGAMIRHANLTYQATTMVRWYGLAEHEPVITLPPIFHITGMGQNLALCLANGLPLVLTYRFEPRTVLGLVERHRPVYAIAAITAFVALSAEPGASAANLGSVRALFSGGAAVPVGVVDAFEQRFGSYIHNAYGLTESASACILVPMGERAPVDQTSGALSIGRAIPGTTVSVVDDDGKPAATGTIGELVVQGPGVCAGYWGKPEETENAFRSDGLHTGDVGFADEDGWIYIVDRKKDLVVVSGYKVWPREVEDALYLHPGVREAAVVGIPDDYRGETVIAFIVLRAGGSATEEDLRAHCRHLLSAYKCPTEFHVVDGLPKTASGKVLRRELAASRVRGA